MCLELIYKFEFRFHRPPSARCILVFGRARHCGYRSAHLGGKITRGNFGCKHLPFLLGEHRRLGHIGPADRVRLQIGAVAETCIVQQAHGNRYLGFARDRTDQDAIKLNRRQRDQRTIGLACGGVQNRKVIGQLIGGLPCQEKGGRSARPLLPLSVFSGAQAAGAEKAVSVRVSKGSAAARNRASTTEELARERSRRGNLGGVASSLTESEQRSS